MSEQRDERDTECPCCDGDGSHLFEGPCTLCAGSGGRVKARTAELYRAGEVDEAYAHEFAEGTE